MKRRQYKKLCKKAAEIMGFVDCDIDDGIYHVFHEIRGMDFIEYDAEPAWDWLVARFDGTVNTMVDEDSECGISWVPGYLRIKATPKNVFAWARL